MNLKELKKSNQIIMESVTGSHLYGTNTPESDVDIRGLFINKPEDYANLQEPSHEIADNSQDTKFYSLKKFFQLAINSNPSIIEMLFIPDELIKFKTKHYDLLKKNGELFMSKKAYYSFTGYAYAQIKKAKGKNKKVHNVEKYMNEKAIEFLRDQLYKGYVTKEWVESRFNKFLFQFLIKNKTYDENVVKHIDWKWMDNLFNAQPELNTLRSPRRENFCHFVDRDSCKMEPHKFPFRPKIINDLSKYDCSSVEHMGNLYRLYENGKGIFKDNQLVFTSIPKNREWFDFVGVLYYNENEYEKAKKEWSSFWEWMSNRNDQRWITQESGEMDYDCKNMMHTVRLILEAENILQNGKPIVRFEGKQLQYLRDIREGKFEYEKLLKWSEDKCEELREKFEKSSLPYQVNAKQINKLYKEVLTL